MDTSIRSRTVVIGLLVLVASLLVTMQWGGSDAPLVEHRLEPVVEVVSQRAVVDAEAALAPPVGAHELPKLQARWRLVLEQGWVGSDASGLPLVDELPFVAAPDDAVAEEDVVNEGSGIVDVSEDDGVPDELAELDEDAAVEDAEEPVAEPTEDVGALLAQLEALQLRMDAVEMQMRDLELENQLLLTATATQSEQIAFLRMALTLRTLNPRR